MVSICTTQPQTDALFPAFVGFVTNTDLDLDFHFALVIYCLYKHVSFLFDTKKGISS